MPSLDDLEKRAVARRVQLGPGQQASHEPDEIEDALRIRQQMVGGQIKEATAEQVVKQMEVENEELDLKRRKVKVEALELDQKMAELEQRRQQGGQGSQPSLMQDVLGAMLEDNRTSRQMLMQFLLEKRASDGRADGPAPALPTLEQRLSEWETIDNLITSHAQRLVPPSSQTPASGGDVASTIRLEESRLKSEIERERMRMEGRQREEEHELRMQQIRADIAFKSEELQEKRERSKRMGDVIEQLGPPAIAAFRESPLLRGPISPQPNTGMPVRCQNAACGITFQIRGDEESVLCPRCGQLHIREGAGVSAPVNAEPGRTLEVIKGGQQAREPETEPPGLT